MLADTSATTTDSLPDPVSVAVRRLQLSRVTPVGESQWAATKYDNRRRAQQVLVTLHDVPSPAGPELLATCGPVTVTSAP